MHLSVTQKNSLKFKSYSQIKLTMVTVSTLVMLFSGTIEAKKKSKVVNAKADNKNIKIIENDQDDVAVAEKLKDYLASQKINLNDLGLLIAKKEIRGIKNIVDLNADRKLIPASISKLATSAAVLKNFPPGFKFKTQLLKTVKSKIINGVLEGDLYIKGGGDPSFVSENMWFLVNQFSRNNIKEIKGDIIVDDSLFDKVRFDESRQEQRVDRAYDAPVGALSFNWNSINIFIRPNVEKNSVEVFLDPQVEFLELSNQATLTSGDDNQISVEKVKNKIFIRGKLGKKSKELAVYKNISEPDIWTAENLRLFLNQRGIKISGSIKNQKTSDEMQVLSEYESKPIEGIMADMNKFSNNYVAEMLTKNLSLKKSTIGNIPDGMAVINENMKLMNIPVDSFELYNPSGLTRENKISARAMVTMLEYIQNDFRIYPEFVNSLPIAGVDGTLKKRMKNEAAERWVRAKTGFLTNVVSLAGFAGKDNGQVYCFAFMYNGQVDEARIKNMYDKILNILLE